MALLLHLVIQSSTFIAPDAILPPPHYSILPLIFTDLTQQTDEYNAAKTHSMQEISYWVDDHE